VETQKILIMIALFACISASASGLTFWESEWNDPCKVMPPIIQDAPDRDNFARGWSGKMTPFTVISCNCVITAWHWHVEIGTKLIFGTAYEDPDYKVVQVFDDIPGDKIVCKVEKISDPYSVPFSKWIELYDSDDEDGKETLLSSYGPLRTEDDETGVRSYVAYPPTYEHHWGRNVLIVWSDVSLAIRFDEVGEPCYIEYEAAAWSGDSGSGWLIKDNNQWKLAGITSSSNCASRISSAVDGIYDAIEEAAEIQNLTKRYFYDTIQEAIDDASDGDVIELPQRTYTENINFLGKAITLQSRDPYNLQVAAATIIEGTGTGNTVEFTAESGAGATLLGITITCSGGNGIYCSSAAPIISNCIIRNCSNDGVYCNGAGPVVRNCIINGCDNGIHSQTSSPVIRNCRIYDNLNRGIWCINSATTIKNNCIYSNASGIKLALDDTSEIENNTIVNNTGYGIEKGAGVPSATITNCILWGNGEDLFEDFSASYSWFTSDGDPLFFDVDGEDNIGGNDDDDYRLTSDSPCINAGDPDYLPDAGEKDIDGGLRVIGGIIDMGAYEQQLYVLLDLDNPWTYQNLPFSTTSQLTADVSVTYDPLSNSSYTYQWEFELPDDVSVVPSTASGGGLNDTSWTFTAPTCNEPNGLSDSGQPLTVKVTVTGDEYGNTVVARTQFGIALLGDVNNDGVVNVTDRSITNAFWRLSSAGPFTFPDCNVNCDTDVNIADRSIVNAIWRGVLGQNSVGSPCPFR